MTRTVGRLLPAVLLALVAAVGVRVWSLRALDGILPLRGLYVDERSFTGAAVVPGSGVFARPPGTYVLSALSGAARDPLRARILFGAVSLVPAAALLSSRRRRERPAWTAACAACLAVCPLMVAAGARILPDVPAAALASLALLAASRERMAPAGFLIGCAGLFRAELLLSLPLMLPASLRAQGGARAWGAAAGGCAAAVLPVLLVNLSAGGGPVIAANGPENLWLGTSWDLVTTPPGIEFEELMAVGGGDPGLQTEFASRAWDSIGRDPGGWALMGLHKALAFLTLPGPGRNEEAGWILRRTGLALLLPLSFAAVALGGGRCLRPVCGNGASERLAVAIVGAGLLSAVIFFPTDRFRLPALAALWFLAAESPPARRDLITAVPLAAVVLALSLFYRYPGMERSGLTSLLAAEQRISDGMPAEALGYLEDAEERGFEGADLDNLRGIALSMSGSPLHGLACFRSAVAAAPGAPTVWKNLAASLWNLGMDAEARDAALRAVSLNPLLIGTLGPILGPTRGDAADGRIR